MKKNLLSIAKYGAFAVALAAMAYSSTALARKPGSGGGTGCPRDILCPDVMAPVICSDGNVYSNGCEAYKACAEDCVPTGDI